MRHAAAAARRNSAANFSRTLPEDAHHKALLQVPVCRGITVPVYIITTNNTDGYNHMIATGSNGN